MGDYYIKNLENKIEWLGTLVTNSAIVDERFYSAVEEFKAFLKNQKNNLPADLVYELSLKNFSNYGDEQSFVNDLRRTYNQYCENKTKKDRSKEMYNMLLKPHNHASEDQNSEYRYGKTKQDKAKEMHDMLFNPRNHASEDERSEYSMRGYTIDEDEVIHRNSKVSKEVFAEAMNILRNIPTEPEHKLENFDNKELSEFGAKFKQRNSGKR